MTSSPAAFSPGLKGVAVFVLWYAALSLLFSLASWGRASGPAPAALSAHDVPELALDLGGHLVFGALAVLPLRSWRLAVAGGLVAVAIDVDHAARYAGLPTFGRASHSLGFLLVAGVGMYALARAGLLGRRFPPMVVGLVGAISVLSHIALDAALRDGMVPLWAPASFRLVGFSVADGLAVQAGVMALAGVVSWRIGRRQRKV